jgi:hypothetical protein
VKATDTKTSEGKKKKKKKFHNNAKTPTTTLRHVTTLSNMRRSHTNAWLNEVKGRPKQKKKMNSHQHISFGNKAQTTPVYDRKKWSKPRNSRKKRSNQKQTNKCQRWLKNFVFLSNTHICSCLIGGGCRSLLGLQFFFFMFHSYVCGVVGGRNDRPTSSGNDGRCSVDQRCSKNNQRSSQVFRSASCGTNRKI